MGLAVFVPDTELVLIRILAVVKVSKSIYRQDFVSAVWAE